MTDKPETHKAPAAKCLYCGKVFAKAGMSRHLESCKARQTSIVTETQAAKGKAGKLFHLRVVGTYADDYWMNIEIPGSATLVTLDDFLRGIWLECCGHLSMFDIEGVHYASRPMGEMGDKSMKVPLEKILQPGMKFHHEYDFGTTTDLTLQVVAEREGKFQKVHDVTVMARNEAPAIMCGKCGKNAAVEVCSYCGYEPAGWLCEDCAETHECGGEAFLPVVNSPRVGQCGYTGAGYEI